MLLVGRCCVAAVVAATTIATCYNVVPVDSAIIGDTALCIAIRVAAIVVVICGVVVAVVVVVIVIYVAVSIVYVVAITFVYDTFGVGPFHYVFVGAFAVAVHIDNAVVVVAPVATDVDI